MTKSELLRRLAAANPHLTLPDAEFVVATIFDVISTALMRGDRVELRRFGAFTVRKHDARIGRNPRTGDKVPISEKHVPFFKPARYSTTGCRRAPAAPAGADDGGCRAFELKFTVLPRRA